MSPDARVLARQLDRLVTRVRLTTAVESAGLGVAVAAWSVPVGLAVAVIIAAVRSRGASRPTVVRRLEEANPGLRNVMVTAGEILDGSLSARPHVADRVFRDATLAMSRADVRAIRRPWRLVAVPLFVAALWVAHAALIRQNAASPPVDRASASRSSSRTPSGELQVIVTVAASAVHRSPARDPGESRRGAGSRKQSTGIFDRVRGWKSCVRDQRREANSERRLGSAVARSHSRDPKRIRAS